jgi:acetoin utilization deacetylase AcuC-like enzyme
VRRGAIENTAPCSRPPAESPLRVTQAGYRAAGRRIAALGPAVLIQEGGYDLSSLGGLVVAALEGAAAGAHD